MENENGAKAATAEDSIKTADLGRSIALAAVLLATVFISIVTASLAWLFNGVIVGSDETDFYGSSLGSYFAGGDGKTPETAYEIEDKVHLYNLAWLQYIGVFNTVGEDGKIHQVYFTLSGESDVIDASGLIIPPIGTKEHPFVGNFNGAGKTISGVTISTYLSESNGDGGIVEHPEAVEEIDKSIGNSSDASIVGFFGVVGDIDGTLKNLIADDSTVEGIENKVNAVYDLMLRDMTIRSDTKQTLIGLLAGYVNASVGNVGIGTSRLVTAADVAALGNSISAAQAQAFISEYSLIGDYNEKVVEWKDLPSGGSSSDDGPNVTPDDDGSWGGTINMLEINTRLTAMLKTNSANANVETTNNYSGYKLSSSTLNVNLYTYKFSEKAGNVICYIASNTTQATYIPVKVTDSSDISTGAETPHPSNNGYITSAGSTTGGKVRARSEYYTAIYNSLGLSGKTSSEADNYNTEGTLSIITYDFASKAFKVIKDEYTDENGEVKGKTTTSVNGYEIKKHTDLKLASYEKVRNKLHTILSSNNFLHGIHFMRYIPALSKDSSGNITSFDITRTQLDAITTTSNGPTVIDTGKDLSLGTNYSVQELLAGSIDFYVQDKGLITAVAGTYYNNTDQTLFDLYKINRGANKEIVSITKIQTIYQDTDGNYVYNPTNTNGLKLKFDFGVTETLPVRYAMYYFEIPVMAGEYAISAKANYSTSDKVNDGAYLVYLDIGANGDSGYSPAPEEPGVTPGGTDPYHSINGLNFVDNATGLSNNSVTTYPVVVVPIKSTADQNSGVLIDYIRTSSAKMDYTVNGASGSLSNMTVTHTAEEGVSVNGGATAFALPPGKKEENI